MEVKVFHDAYETEFGDGFYPFVCESEGSSPIVLKFALKDNAWRQVSGINIKGIDVGAAFLLKLGSNATAIYNTYGEQVYPQRSIKCALNLSPNSI